MYNFSLDFLSHYWWMVVLIILGLSSVRYLLLAGSAYLFFYKAGIKWLKQFKIQKCQPKQKQIRHELRYSLSTILIFSVVGLTVFFLFINGYTKLYTNISDRGWGYFILTLFSMIFIHDAYFYWTHRLLHTRWFFKQFHIVHHRSINPTPLAAYSFHPVEAFIESIIIFPFVLIVPVPIAAFLLFTFLVLIMNVLGHLGFEFFSERARIKGLGKYFTSSTHHNLHHQRNNKNFGYYFTFWDKKMKTLQHESNRTQKNNY